MKRPGKGEYAEFHVNYLANVPSKGNIKTHLKNSWKEANALFGALPEEKGDYTYEEGKWTVKQLIIHLIDTERVFAYRILWFMRGDRAPVPGFNQDHWMENTDVSKRTIKDLLKEWKVVRDNTLFLLSQCTEEQSKMVGTASGWKVSVRAFFYITVGHQNHHLKVFRERYL